MKDAYSFQAHTLGCDWLGRPLASRSSLTTLTRCKIVRAMNVFYATRLPLLRGRTEGLLLFTELVHMFVTRNAPTFACGAEKLYVWIYVAINRLEKCGHNGFNCADMGSCLWKHCKRISVHVLVTVES